MQFVGNLFYGMVTLIEQDTGFAIKQIVYKFGNGMSGQSFDNPVQVVGSK